MKNNRSEENYQIKLVEKDVEEYYPKMLYNIEENINTYFKNIYNEDMQLENILNILKYLEIRSFEYHHLYKSSKYTKRSRIQSASFEILSTGATKSAVAFLAYIIINSRTEFHEDSLNETSSFINRKLFTFI